jgi:hypothetical protein
MTKTEKDEILRKATEVFALKMHCHIKVTLKNAKTRQSLMLIHFYRHT